MIYLVVVVLLSDISSDMTHKIVLVDISALIVIKGISKGTDNRVDKPSKIMIAVDSVDIMVKIPQYPQRYGREIFIVLLIVGK